MQESQALHALCSAACCSCGNCACEAAVNLPFTFNTLKEG